MLADARPDLGGRKSHEQFYKDLDGVLQHATNRANLRRAMGLTDVEDAIRQRAYELYEQRGPGSGTAEDDWLKAEAEIVAALLAREKSPTQQWFEAIAKQNATEDHSEI